MPSSTALLATAAGLTFGLSLIVAIGAQNAFVLRQGLLRQHRTVVVVTCALSDVALIALGVGGAGALLAAVPALGTAARIGGAAFLLGYAALAARRAWRGGAAAVDSAAGAARGPLAVLATTLALTWLNPHVYLDTVVLAGTAADAHGDARWWFAGGMACGSVLWFATLGYGSSALRPLFARPASWRLLDAGIAAIMLALGLSLALGAV
ncbi:MAG TPA: LysE family transporter [Conexibacter sp.]|nr:LysE family transporter [Conexibacter sp.]